jgi:hypothetical protein
MADKFDIGTLDRMYRENMLDPLNNGVRGYLGFDPKTAGSEAYRTGQALSNMPAVGMPAKAAKAIAETPEMLNTLGMFIGKSSKAWDKQSNELAKKLQDKGASPEQIWAATKNMLAPDGKWRQEISDEFARFLPFHIPGRPTVSFDGRRVESNMSTGKVSQTVIPAGYDIGPTTSSLLRHKVLDDAYKNTDIAPRTVIEDLQGARGAFDPTSRTVYLDSKLSKNSGVDSRSTLLHELQHGIQSKEGFAQGTNMEQALFPENAAIFRQLLDEEQVNFLAKPRDPNMSLVDMVEKIKENAQRAFYNRNHGEAEARAVQARKNLSDAQRQLRYPGLDYDVPMNQLIIKK